MSNLQGTCPVVATVIVMGVTLQFGEHETIPPTDLVIDTTPEVGYARELSFQRARAVEHNYWYTGKKARYQSRADLQRAAAKKEIVPAPRWFEDSPFVLAAGIGKRDHRHRALYLLSAPRTWQVLQEIEQELGKTQAIYRLESLTRCVTYPLGQGSKTTSHNWGGAFDVDLNQSALSNKDKDRLHQALYRLERAGELVYYVEADSAKNGRIAVYDAADFCKGGQVHVVANPRVFPHGTGVWIWQLEKSLGGDIDAIVEQAVQAHLDHVLLRVSDFGYKWAHFNSKTKIHTLAKLLRAHGIRVYAWGFHTPKDSPLPSQVAFIKSMLDDDDFDGYVLNVETQFANQDGAARDLFEPVRKYRDEHHFGKLIAFSTYSRVDRGAGATMPAKTFAQYSDAGMPQAYWRDFQWTPTQTLSNMCEAWSEKVDPSYVLIPSGHIRSDFHPGIASPREFAEFLYASRNYYGRTIWDMEDMKPEHWRVLEMGWPTWYAKHGTRRERAFARKILANMRN